MHIVYNIIIQLYYLLIVIFSLFNDKAKNWLTGRKKIFEILEQKIEQNGNIIWFHCASLGEFEQGRPLIENLKNKMPESKILLTFFSPSGYEVRKNYNIANWVFYLPLDTKQNAIKFLKIVNPQMAIFVKYEFWYNYLNQLNKNKVPVFLISAIFRKNQIFFNWYGSWYKNILKFFSHIFVQDEDSLKLLNSISINDVTITGDTRFDRVYAIANETKEIDIVNEFSKDSFVIVAGSVWQPDINLLVNYINSSTDNLKFILVPHEINESNLKNIETSVKQNVIRFSKANNAELGKCKVLIIDNVGMLSALYKYGKIAYIGGGFGKGIHNILEAAVYGMPVIFGPNYKKFNEAVKLIENNGAISVSDQTELNNALNLLVKNEEKLKQMSFESKNFVIKNTGSTDKISSLLASHPLKSKIFFAIQLITLIICVN